MRRASLYPYAPYLFECGVSRRLFSLGFCQNHVVDKRNPAPHFLFVHNPPHRSCTAIKFETQKLKFILLMKKLFLLAALCVAAAFSSCSKHDNEINHVEPPVPPETTPLAIAFAEGNSLEFNVGETKTVHYTITGGSDKTVVKAELQTPADAYTVETTPASTSEGTIMITAKMLSTYNCILVSVSDGDRSITAEIAVSTTSKITITVAAPGTLSQLLAAYDTTKIKELTVSGNLNGLDITTLKNLLKLAVLDMENANLEVLPTNAFQDNKSLTSVKLPKTLKIIGNGAFSGCSNLRSITIPNSVTTIGSSAFVCCYDLTSVTIPDSVTSIGDGAFHDCHSLTSITTPNNITSIGSSTFYGCCNLISVTISDSVTSIGDGAFRDCRSLTSIKIPNGVTSIRYRTFSGCRSLTSITIPDSITIIEEDAFSGCSSLESITIPDSVTSIGNWAFFGCSGLTSITIPNGVTKIGSSAFSDCVSLTSITIPDSVTSIGDYVFSRCSSLSAFYGKFASSDNRCLIVNSKLIAVATADLTSYIISDSVKEIGGSAFSGCSSLTSVTIPDGVTTIGSSAFSDCVSLTSITIGNGVTEIDSFSFSNCISLTSITIPGSMTTIGMSTFSSCNRLTVIYCKAIVPPSVSIHGAFNGVSATLYVPTGCKAAYAAAVGWSKFTIIETEF